MTTGKTISLTRQTFVDKVMSLLLNMLSRLVITFLPRSKRLLFIFFFCKRLLISWLQSPSAVILEPPKIKSATVSTVSPSICHEVMGLDAMILVFWMLFKPTFSLSSFTFLRRQRQRTPVLLPGKSHGRRSLVGCCLLGHEESDTTEWIHFHFSLSCIGEENGNPLQCSCKENPRGGGVWWAAVYGVAELDTTETT